MALQSDTTYSPTPGASMDTPDAPCPTPLATIKVIDQFCIIYAVHAISEAVYFQYCAIGLYLHFKCITV